MSLRVGGGALIVIALFFGASGALRFGNGLGLSVAWASNGPEIAAPTETCPIPPAALASALSAREARVLAQETAIADRLAALQLAEDALKGRLEGLQAAEASLRATLSIADAAAEEDLLKLTAVYEAMKPKDAALLFDAMNAQFAAGFLGRMRADAAASVIAGMTPEKAYAVSAVLAGRNALAPKE